MTLLTTVLLAAFIALGIWQWNRGAAKQSVWAEFLREAPAEPLAGRSIDSLPRFTRIRVRGEFHPAQQFLLDNRSHGGRPGYEVLTPFVSNSQYVLVNRGWVPFTGYRDRLPDITMPADGAREIVARVDELPAAGLAGGRAAPDVTAPWPKLTSFPTAEELATSLGQELPRRILLLDANVPGGYVREWSPPGLAPDRHFSYAIQWWGFATVLLVLYFGLNLRKVK